MGGLDGNDDTDGRDDSAEGQDQARGGASVKKKRLDVALVISILALGLSGAQLFFTSPLIYQQIFAARLVVENISDAQNASGLAGFVLGNIGRSAAQDIQLGILAMEGDTFTLLPEFRGRIDPNESVRFVTYTITIDQLHPGEVLAILLQPGELHEGQELPRQYDMGGVSFTLPSIVFLRSKRGPGEILATRFDPTPVPHQKGE